MAVSGLTPTRVGVLKKTPAWAFDASNNPFGIAAPGGGVATPVYVKAFTGITGDGVADDTAQVAAAHAIANSMGAPVSYAGLTKVAIQANAQIPVKTSVDFDGCEVVILGGVVATPNWSDPFNVCYVVSDDACPIVEVTGAVSSGDLVAGSITPTLGLFDGHGYAKVTCALQVPNRAKTGTSNYSQSFKINRNGKASLPLSVDLSAHAAAITVRYRKTSKRALTIRGLSVTEGAWNQQKIFQINRCNVVVEDTTLLFDTPGTFDNICSLIEIVDSSDIVVRRLTSTGRPVTTTSGSYCLTINGGADIHVYQMNALTGWGATGTNDVNGLHYHGCVLNRVDTHSSAHNVFIDDCDLHESGVVYGWGGGVISVRNSRANRCWVVANRADYGGTFFGEIIVQNVEVSHSGSASYYVVDLATNPLGASTDVYAPRTIRVENVTRVGVASSSNAPLVPVRLYVRGATDVVYAPATVIVSNLAATTMPSGWRFTMELDVLNLERAPGVTTTAVSLSNIRAPSAGTNVTGLMDADSIRTPTNAVALRLFVTDCENFHTRMRLTNGPVIIVRNTSINGIQTVTSGTRPRLDIDGCRFLSGASGYTNPPVGAGRSGNGNFTSISNSEFGAAVAYDCSAVSMAFGNYVRTGATAPLIPAAATLESFFSGFWESGAIIAPSIGQRTSLAVGDNGTVNTAVLQAEIDYVKANGGTLYLPPGIYRTGLLSGGSATKHFRILGAGAGLTQLVHDTGNGTLFNAVGSASGFTIEDLTIDCKHSVYAHASANHGIAVADCNGVRVRRVRVRDYKNSAILFYSTVADTYGDCIAEDCESDGLNAANNGMLAADLLRSGFINCRALNVGKSGSPCYALQLKNKCQDSFITGCYGSGATSGLALGNYDASGDHVANRAIGNRVYNCDTGLSMGLALGDIVMGLDIDMAGAGQNAVDLNTNSVGNVVKGVIVRNLAAGKLAVRCRSGDTDNVVEIDLVTNVSGVAGARVQFDSGSLRNYVSIAKFSNPNDVSDSNTLVSDSSTGSTNVFEYKSLPNRQSATIASGAITLRHGRISAVRVDTEAAAATDDLATINGGVDGQVITISQAANARDITIKHSTGNIRLTGAADLVFTSAHQRLSLEYSSVLTAWVETGRGTAS